MEHEVRLFTAEEDALYYWIYDESGELDSLYTEVTKESVPPYTPVYAALKVYNKKVNGRVCSRIYRNYEVVEVKPLDSSTGQ